MLKLLIVEDERWEREGLRDFLDWNLLGIEIAGLASDGVEGLHAARDLLPDIVISDIKMPGLNGLEMCRQIKLFLPNVSLIMLTGYDDFKFAKEAISFNAFDYLLKPIEEKELLEVIERVVVKCRKERKKLLRRL
jgi:two-component system response regulator YesN